MGELWRGGEGAIIMQEIVLGGEKKFRVSTMEQCVIFRGSV